MVRPVTSPQGRPTVHSGTTSTGRSGRVVVVVEVVVVVDVVVVAWVEGGAGGVSEGEGVVSGAATAGVSPPAPSVRSLAPTARARPTARKITTARKRAARSGGGGPGARWVTGP